MPEEELYSIGEINSYSVHDVPCCKTCRCNTPALMGYLIHSPAAPPKAFPRVELTMWTRSMTPSISSVPLKNHSTVRPKTPLIHLQTKRFIAGVVFTISTTWLCSKYKSQQQFFCNSRPCHVVKCLNTDSVQLTCP